MLNYVWIWEKYWLRHSQHSHRDYTATTHNFQTTTTSVSRETRVRRDLDLLGITQWHGTKTDIETGLLKFQIS